MKSPWRTAGNENPARSFLIRFDPTLAEAAETGEAHEAGSAG
jgi:hypothetical protein